MQRTGDPSPGKRLRSAEFSGMQLSRASHAQQARFLFDQTDGFTHFGDGMPLRQTGKDRYLRRFAHFRSVRHDVFLSIALTLTVGLTKV